MFEWGRVDFTLFKLFISAHINPRKYPAQMFYIETVFSEQSEEKGMKVTKQRFV